VTAAATAAVEERDHPRSAAVGAAPETMQRGCDPDDEVPVVGGPPPPPRYAVAVVVRDREREQELGRDDAEGSPERAVVGGERDRKL
jgi:hypothetical protein